MRSKLNLICGLFIVILFVTTSSALDEGFLKATCNEAKDCYVIDDSSQGPLQLECWESVHKCKCSNAFRSIFRLQWDSDNGKCLMSKYGPCGEKGPDLVVGCQDNFVCVDNQCRDPKDTSAEAVKPTPFIFDESQCSNSCQFSENLSLTCDSKFDRCSCEKIRLSDGGDSYWDLRNYDGDKNCSVGKFGPCGSKHGITIDCHGDGITCVDGTCVNAIHAISDLGEDCAYDKNCQEGLLCSVNSVCIEPFSVEIGKRCSGTMQCQKGLLCQTDRPWSAPICR